MMSFDKWTAAEKKIARRAFEGARDREFAALIARLKQMAVQLADSAGIWDIHNFLSAQLRDIERKYDYRYSRLIMVFGQLMREKWLEEKDMAGLSEDKVEAIRRIATH
jgi:hypothetical protein